MFTKGDLASLTINASVIADGMVGTYYCEHCTVVEVSESEQYCLGCYAQLYADDICNMLFDIEMDKLAAEVTEKIAIDGGLY